jgi:hypothetical protein
MIGKQGKIRRQRNAVKGLKTLIDTYQSAIDKYEQLSPYRKEAFLQSHAAQQKEGHDRIVAQIRGRKQAAELCLINTIRNLGGVN